MKLISLLILVCFCSPITAQEENVAPRCRTVFLERPRDSPDTCYLFDGKKSYPVSLSSMNLSETITLSAGATSIGITPDLLINPDLFPADAPIIKIPENSTEFYLVLRSDPNNKIFPVKLFAASSGDEKVRLGETLWLNLSKNVVVGKLGNKDLRISPGQSIVSSFPLKQPGYYKVKFDYLPVGNTQIQPIMRKTWWFDPKSKYLGFIINSGDRLPKIYTFRDRPDLDPAKEENEE